jgi:protein-tyrosine-phosphatase
MNVEGMPHLLGRVAKHAALADPARLLIVDALSVGDASPSELQARLGIASNLMAHHLKLLEASGIVVRRRSEGDRRRTYLRLVPASLDGLVPQGSVPLGPRVVFVCTANSARSQLAAALWRRSSPVPVASAGTHPAERIDPGAVAVARRRGMPLRARRPRSVGEVITADDLVITVCDTAHEELDAAEVIHWSVPDPVAVGTETAFDRAFDELSDRVDDLSSRITPPV